MIDPGKALILFGITAAVLTVLFIPKYGLFAQWKRAVAGEGNQNQLTNNQTNK